MLTLRKWTWCQVYFGSLWCQVRSPQQGVFDPMPTEHPLTHIIIPHLFVFEKISCTNRLRLLHTDVHGVLISAFIVGYAPFYLFCRWRAAGACSKVLTWWALQKERRLAGEDRYSWVRLDREYCCKSNWITVIHSHTPAGDGWLGDAWRLLQVIH